MKRKTFAILLTAMLLILAACGKEEADVPTEPEEIQPLEVELTVDETAAVDETVQFKALVTQGDEKVEDAEEVVFEVWEEGKKDESEMIDSTNEKEGIYTADKAFDHDGLFHVQVHVTARGMHVMPKKEIVVGEGGHYEEQVEGDEHAHADGFSMHFMKPEQPAAGEEVELMTHVQMNDEGLVGARVRYEIWNEGNEDAKDWADADEQQPGEYTANHTFSETGSYQIIVHVEGEEQLHEHEQFEVEVK